eukprot:6825731-Heterocapsa_arctica.AAC.1
MDSVGNGCARPKSVQQPWPRCKPRNAWSPCRKCIRVQRTPRPISAAALHPDASATGWDDATGYR